MAKKRLLLTRETLRRLTEENARRVVGGVTVVEDCAPSVGRVITNQSFCAQTPPFNSAISVASGSGPSAHSFTSAPHSFTSAP